MRRALVLGIAAPLVGVGLGPASALPTGGGGCQAAAAAIDTGYRQDDIALWIAPSAPGVFAVRPDRSEFWTSVRPSALACD